MTRPWTTILWGALVLLAILVGWSLTGGLPEYAGVMPTLAVMIIVTMADALSPRWRRRLAVPVRWLRQRRVLYWLVIVLVLAGGLAAWLVGYQPLDGHALAAVEYFLLLTLAWVLVYLLFYDQPPARQRQ